MNNFQFYSPTEFVFGKDTEDQAGLYVKKHGGTNVLIHYGGGSAVKSGLLDRIKKSLEKENISYTELGGVKPNPRDTLVYEGIKLCREKNIDFILAVGGGSVIDSAKAIAVGVPYEGDFWDFYCGKKPEKALPVATVLTIAAAGSEGSGNSVITKEEGMFKRGADGDAIRPKFSILNPALTQTLPAFQTAAGVERTGVYDDETAHSLLLAVGATVEVTGGTVNVRSGPGKKFPVLGVARKGDVLPYQGMWEASDEDSLWLLVAYTPAGANTPGNAWVSEKYGKLI
jgi:alcohol dehydrogenase YqhD (iron-dependent ADH family)